MGYKVTKIHCFISFNQTDFLKNYITNNINDRKATNDKNLKDLFKLCTNSVFGKTLQNPRKYKKYKFFFTKGGENSSKILRIKNTIQNSCLCMVGFICDDD